MRPVIITLANFTKHTFIGYADEHLMTELSIEIPTELVVLTPDYYIVEFAVGKEKIPSAQLQAINGFVVLELWQQIMDIRTMTAQISAKKTVLNSTDVRLGKSAYIHLHVKPSLSGSTVPANSELGGALLAVDIATSNAETATENALAAKGEAEQAAADTTAVIENAGQIAADAVESVYLHKHEVYNTISDLPLTADPQTIATVRYNKTKETFTNGKSMTIVFVPEIMPNFTEEFQAVMGDFGITLLNQNVYIPVKSIFIDYNSNEYRYFWEAFDNIYEGTRFLCETPGWCLRSVNFGTDETILYENINYNELPNFTGNITITDVTNNQISTLGDFISTTPYITANVQYHYDAVTKTWLQSGGDCNDCSIVDTVDLLPAYAKNGATRTVRKIAQWTELWVDAVGEGLKYISTRFGALHFAPVILKPDWAALGISPQEINIGIESRYIIDSGLETVAQAELGYNKSILSYQPASESLLECIAIIRQGSQIPLFFYFWEDAFDGDTQIVWEGWNNTTVLTTEELLLNPILIPPCRNEITMIYLPDTYTEAQKKAAIKYAENIVAPKPFVYRDYIYDGRWVLKGGENYVV